MPRKPTTYEKRSNRTPTSQRILSWLDRTMANTDRAELAVGLKDLGYGSWNKSVVSKINANIRGLSADELYAISAVARVDIPKPLTAYEMDAMRKEVRRAAGKGAPAPVENLPAITEEWLKEPSRIEVLEVLHEENASESEEANESAAMSAATDGEITMDAIVERRMKSLVCEAFEIYGGLEPDDALMLYETMQARARKNLSPSKSADAEDNPREVALALMTAFGLQP
jgi:hypothetical protein